MRTVAVMCLLLGVMTGASQVLAEDVMIAKGRKVKLDYVLTVDNAVVESTEGKQPLEYTHGQNMLIPGLEKGLEGMKVGEKKSIAVKASEGYGDVNSQLLREFDRARLPEGLVPEPGIMLEMQDPQGESFPCTITKVMEKTVMLDFNHPLAGKDLRFDVTIASVE